MRSLEWSNRVIECYEDTLLAEDKHIEALEIIIKNVALFAKNKPNMFWEILRNIEQAKEAETRGLGRVLMPRDSIEEDNIGASKDEILVNPKPGGNKEEGSNKRAKPC